MQKMEKLERRLKASDLRKKGSHRKAVSIPFMMKLKILTKEFKVKLEHLSLLTI